MLTKIKVNCLVVVVNPFPWRLKLAVLVRILCPACPEVVSSSLPPIPSLSHHPPTVAFKKEKKSSSLPPTLTELLPSKNKEEEKNPPSCLQKIKVKKTLPPP